MKFQKHLASEAPSVYLNEDFRTALIKYKILKKHISAMDIGQISSRLGQQVDGECSICFEPFQFAISVITTTCNHGFHPNCLIQALGTGPCTSCPLCRRTAAGLVPAGLDGDILRFLAMVHVNANAVQRCHESMMRLLESRLAGFQELLRRGGGRHREHREPLAAAASEDLARLQTVLRFSALNSEGFRKILKKFDKRTGCGASSQVLADLRRRGFVADAAVFGNGRCAALRIALHEVLRAARAGAG